MFFVFAFRAPSRKYGYTYSNYCQWIYVSYWVRFTAKWKKDLKGYSPKCPAFFAYSTPRLGLKFYSSSYLRRLKELDGIEKQYAGDHWLHYKATSEEYNQDLLKFLNE